MDPTVYPQESKNGFNLVILGNLLIAFEMLLGVYIYVMVARLKTFTGAYMKQFKDLHKAGFGTDRAPDMG